MILFGLALGVLELVAFGLLFLLLVIGCTVDRRFDNEGFKWWVVVGALAVGTFWWYHNDLLSLSGAWAAVTTFAFWVPVLIYVGAGLVYCIPEFVMDVRRSAKFYKAEWSNFLTQRVSMPVYAGGEPVSSTPPVAEDGAEVVSEKDAKAAKAVLEKLRAAASHFVSTTLGRGYRGDSNLVKTQEVSHADVLRKARELSGDDKSAEATDYRAMADALTKQFVGSYKFKNRIVQIEVKDFEIAPVVNKLELSEHVAAWTIFWPAYAVALLIGDLLTELWNIVADFLVHFCGRFVRMSFSDVFKLS